MIVFQNKSYMTNSLFPNTNFSDDANAYIVDETTAEGKLLVNKIQQHAPFYDLVLCGDKLVDITPTEKPIEIIEDEPIDEEALIMAEALIDIDTRLTQLEQQL